VNRICLALVALVLGSPVHADASGSAEPRAVVENVYTLFAAGDVAQRQLDK
jgi:hypothetical protein